MAKYSGKSNGGRSEAPVRQPVTTGTSDRGKLADLNVPAGRPYTYAPKVKKGS